MLQSGDRADAPLTLFWLPASAEELRRSDLLLSRQLAAFAARCVAMRVVRIDNDAHRSLQLSSELPVAVLADGAGAMIGRVESNAGTLSRSPVERLVGTAVEARTADAEAQLDRARELADSDAEAAAAIYRSVAEQQCLAPRQARDAKRALRKLQRR